MTRSLLRAVILTSAFAFFSSAAAQSASTTTDAPSAVQTLGCYSKADPLVEQGSYTFQTSGYCQTQCVALNKAVMAITGGSTCYCGTELPALDLEVDQSKCNSPCNGYDSQTCGGLGYWQVYLTGLTADVDTAANSTSAAAPTSTQATQTSATTQPAVVTKAGATVVVTASASSSANAEKSGGSSKVGIAVGVVVGVVAVAAIAGGTLLWFRRKRNRDIEEEHRRNAAIGSLGTQSDKSSKTDQRLDPSIYSHRRQSIGSIADERDFSRRILQVRNPDRDSKASNLA
ncbi:Protein SLG1 [Elasticomyces elasticus]|uniref:WSC domain n=1 Tax=Exophiala sideris TaxID=1016849 RepID=A0ABR0JSF5_9EURO|nr:Protein SLG1 [Elasticomyces elasticus]KAK5039872.1 WSC domain [Exophiala sideris]KAK5041424.1 Protein SLG1 [Exophiala sideris]KAK5068251.1 WSC domain [Exophiala sideris]KAK5187552.1 WSC domain [Eurotiomycetes sp. CCFEE 6388]